MLTWRQRKVLQVIRDSLQHRGYPPSMEEIAEATGMVIVSDASEELSTLESKGYLRRDASGPRKQDDTGPEPEGRQHKDRRHKRSG